MIQGNTFVNQYLILKNLGKGSHGKVKLCLNTEDNTLYAVKIVNKRKLRALDLRHKQRSRGRSDTGQQSTHMSYKEELKREIVVMKKLDHPNVVKLFEVHSWRKVQLPVAIYLLLSCCGTLFLLRLKFFIELRVIFLCGSSIRLLIRCK